MSTTRSAAMSDTAVKVTISDPDTGEVFDETVIDNDYSIVCAGTCHVASAQAYANGTHVLTVKGRDRIPEDYPVRPLRSSEQYLAKGPVTCGTCHLTWDDGIITGITPAPSARCPFEPFHEDDTDPEERRSEALDDVIFAWGTPDEDDAVDLSLPFLTIERCTYDRSVYLASHATPEDASRYLAGQEYPEDWAPQALINLDTGEEFYPEIHVVWHAKPTK